MTEEGKGLNEWEVEKERTRKVYGQREKSCDIYKEKQEKKQQQETGIKKERKRKKEKKILT